MKKYLLDVNALLAWWHVRSPHNAGFHKWAALAGGQNFVTCAIVELGFIRNSMQAYGLTLGDAKRALAELKEKTGGYIADCPPPDIASWSTTGSKTTDAYLCQLAAANGVQLATFDTGIKDAAAHVIS